VGHPEQSRHREPAGHRERHLGSGLHGKLAGWGLNSEWEKLRTINSALQREQERPWRRDAPMRIVLQRRSLPSEARAGPRGPTGRHATLPSRSGARSRRAGPPTRHKAFRANPRREWRRRCRRPAASRTLPWRKYVSSPPNTASQEPPPKYTGGETSVNAMLAAALRLVILRIGLVNYVDQQSERPPGRSRSGPGSPGWSRWQIG